MTDDLQQAYEAGVQDGRMGAKTSDINAVELQKRLNYSDEAVICYLNGVGDADRSWPKQLNGKANAIPDFSLGK